MRDHTDATELALFVQGELDPSRLASFEAHVTSCDVCATLLAREARLELALIELGGAVAAEPAPHRRLGAVPRRMVSAAVIAIAAVAVLVVLRRGEEPVREAGARSIPSVVCAEGPEQAACVLHAHHQGLFVRYPTWAGPPPLGGVVVRRNVRARVASEPARLGPSSPPFTTTSSEI